MRNANGAVEESKISTHMSTFQGVGEDGEWECQHGCPSTSDEQEGNEERILVVEEIDGDETDASENETQAVDELTTLEQWNDDCPKHGTDSLNCEKDAHPVGCFLILRKCV